MHKTQKLLNLLLSKPVVTLPEIMKLKIASHTKAISNLRQAGYLITNKKYWPRVGKSEYVLNWWCIDDVYMSNEQLIKIRKDNAQETNEQPKQTSQWLFNQIIKRFKSL